MMAASHPPALDPRIRRTRQALQRALEALLPRSEFEQLSVQDIATEAGVNRATFYDHYPDKFALLECMVAGRFEELLAARAVKFDGNCPQALRAIVLAVCDYLAGLPPRSCQRQRHLEPHLESAVIAVVRTMMLSGLRRHPPAGNASPEMIATMASWAIFGGAREWMRTPKRCRAERIVETIFARVAPMLAA